jgi:hypothetical protein
VRWELPQLQIALKVITARHRPSSKTNTLARSGSRIRQAPAKAQKQVAQQTVQRELFAEKERLLQRNQPLFAMQQDMYVHLVQLGPPALQAATQQAAQLQRVVIPAPPVQSDTSVSVMVRKLHVHQELIRTRRVSQLAKQLEVRSLPLLVRLLEQSLLLVNGRCPKAIHKPQPALQVTHATAQTSKLFVPKARTALRNPQPPPLLLLVSFKTSPVFGTRCPVQQALLALQVPETLLSRWLQEVMRMARRLP